MKKYNFWNDPFGSKRREEREINELVASLKEQSKRVDEALLRGDYNEAGRAIERMKKYP